MQRKRAATGPKGEVKLPYTRREPARLPSFIFSYQAPMIISYRTIEYIIFIIRSGIILSKILTILLVFIMGSKIDFTISIPPQCTLPVASPSPVTLSQTIASRPVSDSILQREQTSQGITDCLSQIWKAIVDFLKKIWECFCCKKKSEILSPEEIERRRVVEEEELAVWQTQMGRSLRVGANNGDVSFVDLSGRIARPGFCSALQMERIPQIGHYTENYPVLSRLIAVKLPARQLQRFSDAIKNELANVAPDNLDLYFVVWQDIPRMFEDAGQPGKRNLIYHPIAFPNAQRGETHCQDMPMGIFETEGIEEARGDPSQALPFNRFGLQNVHIHPADMPFGQAMAISPDHARFHLPAERRWSTFHSACKFPNNRAAAVFGVIIDSDNRTQELNVLLRPLGQNQITLQEYKTGIQNSQLDPSLKRKIAHVLDFYTEGLQHN